MPLSPLGSPVEPVGLREENRQKFCSCRQVSRDSAVDREGRHRSGGLPKENIVDVAMIDVISEEVTSSALCGPGIRC